MGLGSLVNCSWLRTEHKDLHPGAPELAGGCLHRILRLAVRDDHQNFGEVLPGPTLLGEAVLQDIVQSIACRRNETSS